MITNTKALSRLVRSKLLNLHSEEICFTHSDSFCVSFIKMIEPTDIVGHSQITNSYKARKYYSIFLNTMASIAKVLMLR